MIIFFTFLKWSLGRWTIKLIIVIFSLWFSFSFSFSSNLVSNFLVNLFNNFFSFFLFTFSEFSELSENFSKSNSFSTFPSWKKKNIFLLSQKKMNLNIMIKFKKNPYLNIEEKVIKRK